MFSYNSRFLSKHSNDIITLLELLSTKFSFILLTETWLKHDFTSVFNIPEYTAIHNYRTNKNSGGTAIFCTNEFNCLNVEKHQ